MSFEQGACSILSTQPLKDCTDLATTTAKQEVSSRALRRLLLTLLTSMMLHTEARSAVVLSQNGSTYQENLFPFQCVFPADCTGPKKKNTENFLSTKYLDNLINTTGIWSCAMCAHLCARRNL